MNQDAGHASLSARCERTTQECLAATPDPTFLAPNWHKLEPSGAPKHRSERFYKIDQLLCARKVVTRQSFLDELEVSLATSWGHLSAQQTTLLLEESKLCLADTRDQAFARSPARSRNIFRQLSLS
ncbi:MAG: hypothetical protein FHK80_12035 [Azoarcus sp. PHD]|nr:MAG: hypothetical protein FHK80_12035 [Azoarcus sp. PHD]